MRGPKARQDVPGSKKRGTLWRRVKHRCRDRGEDFCGSRRHPDHQPRQEWRLEGAALAGADRGRPAAVLGTGGMRRLRRQHGRGFLRLSAAGRFAVAVPLAETMLAGWLLAQARIASPEGAMTVAPPAPGIASRSMPMAAFRDARAACRLRKPQNTSRCWRMARTDCRSRWSRRQNAGSRPGLISAATAATP